MNVVALLSGGKDSCYTLLKVRAHGHTVTALAHITPPCDEPDSFMYQSVASSAISSLATALRLPLVTSPTHARAKNTSLAYSPTDGDEVEDLVTLLQNVKAQFPQVDAVCAGALWSDYQRLRVENAASRLGLLSLAPLWRRQQSGLLDEMIAAGVHAVLVKVAGIGLNGSHLGKSLSQMRPVLRKLEALYGSHVCGEGGEYETLVLWMPGFEQQVVLDQVETVLHSDDAVAPVSFLRIRKLHLARLSEEQRAWPQPAKAELPPVFHFEPSTADIEESPQDEEPVEVAGSATDVSVGESGNFLHITCRSDKSGGEGVHEACQLLERTLQDHDSSLSDVVTVHLHLSTVSGERYTSANSGYSKVFGRPECVPPPGRACVSIGPSPANAPTTIETLVRRNRIERPPTLHVQSLSEWAPPCIGPYAQFVEEDGIIHLSGALPLYAPKAAVLPGMPVKKQVEVCALNIRRTLEASRSCVVKLGLFVVYVVGSHSEQAVMAAMNTYLLHKRSVCVLVPAEGLPKGALVEIRAVGVLRDDDLQLPFISSEKNARDGTPAVNYEAIVCGSFGYVVVRSSRAAHSESDVCAQVLDCIDTLPLTTGSHPLALQLYLRRLPASSYRGSLREQFPRTGITVFSAPWLASCAEWTAILTFALQ